MGGARGQRLDGVVEPGQRVRMVRPEQVALQFPARSRQPVRVRPGGLRDHIGQRRAVGVEQVGGGGGRELGAELRLVAAVGVGDGVGLAAGDEVGDHAGDVADQQVGVVETVI